MSSQAPCLSSKDLLTILQEGESAQNLRRGSMKLKTTMISIQVSSWKQGDSAGLEPRMFETVAAPAAQ